MGILCSERLHGASRATQMVLALLGTLGKKEDSSKQIHSSSKANMSDVFFFFNYIYTMLFLRSIYKVSF